MTDFTFYRHEVLPQINRDQRQAFVERYPQIVLQPGRHNTCSVADWPVLMLVGLTGSGKTTTLKALAERRMAGHIAYSDVLPSRRDLADMVVIPTAQVLLGESVKPVKDRVQRFRYTRVFAGEVPGGLATAFAWLHLADEPDGVLVSEGIRGQDEIAFALTHFPAWHVVEMEADLLTRLTRLSNRADSFDQAAGITDVSFLPLESQSRVLAALQSGEVSPAALAIVRAEAENYGFASSQAGHPHYTCVQTDKLPPDVVADRAVAVIQRIKRHA